MESGPKGGGRRTIAGITQRINHAATCVRQSPAGNDANSGASVSLKPKCSAFRQEGMKIQHPRRLWPILLGCTLVAHSSARAQAPHTALKRAALTRTALTRTALRRTIDSIGQSAIRSGRITGLTIAVAHGQSAPLVASFGHSASSTAAAISDTSVFRIASITKQFTAAAVLQLVERHRLSLDARVSEYIAAWPADRAAVTIRQLLTHTAGVREVRFSNVARPPVLTNARTRRDTIEAYIVADSSDFAAGTSFRYSNAGYFLLGRVVERVSGESLAGYWHTHFFVPLRMRHSADCDAIPASMHTVIGDERDGAERAIPTTAIRMADVYAAGAICSTAGDLLRWRRALESGRVLAPHTYAQMNDSSMTTGIGPAYGFGVFLGVLAAHPWIAHNGSINGFATRLASYPRDRLHVAILANTGGANVTPIERAVTRHALGLPDPAPRALAVSEADAKRFVGRYEDTEHGLVATVRAENGVLIGRLWQMGTTTLRSQGNGVFALEIDHDFRVTFRGNGTMADRMDVTDGVQGTTLRRTP
jgi:D-alanyl-D-alanine carboxypeptidase